MAASHLALAGLTAAPLSESCGPDGRRALIAEAYRKRTVEGGVSKIDKMLVQFLLAHHREMTEDFPEATRLYVELLEGDSFVSPIAGIHAARMLKAQGKNAEAKDISRRVSGVYPHFQTATQDSKKGKQGDRP